MATERAAAWPSAVVLFLPSRPVFGEPSAFLAMWPEMKTRLPVCTYMT
jgi:hypothetical protein